MQKYPSGWRVRSWKPLAGNDLQVRILCTAPCRCGVMGSQYLAKASHRESGVWVQIPAFALTTAHEEIHGLFYMQKKHQYFSLFCISQYALCSLLRAFYGAFISRMINCCSKTFWRLKQQIRGLYEVLLYKKTACPVLLGQAAIANLFVGFFCVCCSVRCIGGISWLWKIIAVIIAVTWCFIWEWGFLFLLLEEYE